MSRGILTDLAIKLSADVAQLSSGLNQVNTRLQKQETQVSKIGGLIGKAFAGIAVAGFVKQLADASIHLMKMKEEVADVVEGAANIDVVTGKLKAMSTVFQVDMNNALNSTNTLVKQMGVNWYYALELIEKGLSLSGMDREAFLQQVQQYAPMFKEAGIEAKEMIAIINTGLDAGVSGDKAAAAIKGATNSLREMTKATSDSINALGLNAEKISENINNGTISIYDAIKLISQRMSELPSDSTAVGNAMTDVFKKSGRDAGYKFLTSFKDGFNLDEAIAGSELAQARLKLTKAATEIATIWSNTLGKDSTWWQNFKADVAGIGAQVVKGMAGALGGFDYAAYLDNIQLIAKEQTADGLQSTLDDIMAKIKEANRKLNTDYGFSVFGIDFFDLPEDTRKQLKAELKYYTDQYEEYRKKLQVIKRTEEAPTGGGGGGSGGFAITPKPYKLLPDPTALEIAGEKIGTQLSKMAGKAFQREWKEGGYILGAMSYRLPDMDTDSADKTMTYWEKLNLQMTAAEGIASNLTGIFATLGSGISTLADKEVNAAAKIGATAATISALISQYLALMAAKSAEAEAGKGFPYNIIATAAGIAGMMAVIAPFIKKRATGGSTDGLTLVGERGPELFDGSGYVYNSQRTKDLLGGGGGGGTVIFRIAGDDLMGVLQRNQIKIDQFA